MTLATDARPAAPPDLGVAVVTVNWNGWRDTLACLAALRGSRGAAWRLIIVDNASTDDSRSHLSDLGDDVTTLWAPTNGGWTGGNNIGVA
ncbi:glycosyltransferase, partial [Phenylobacterium sp.]|uniref:glycosyltransferase n=1 Tax=Phenylobacterium sp. TaxID=1871053 RepID=UPI00286C5A53